MSVLSDVGRTFLLLLLIMSLGACLAWAFWEFEQVRDRRWRRAKRWILLIGLFGLVTWPAPARDLDGPYATSPLKPWFDQLKSRTGLCCSNADGYVVEDADLGSEERSLSRASARVPRLQSHDVDRCARQFRHY